MSSSNTRPFLKFKSLLKLNVNVFSSLKVLKFKKKKWKNFQFFFKNDLKPTKFRKYKLLDQVKTTINKRSLFELNYKTQYFKKLFVSSKLFNLFFGKFLRKYFVFLKSKVVKFLSINKNFVFEFLESRLDLVLFRSKFFVNLKSARQAIKHRHIYVNEKQIRSSSLILKTGDLIKINSSIWSACKSNLVALVLWPLTPKFLVVNYTTFEVLFLGNLIKETNFVFYSLFQIKLHKFLLS